MKRSTYRVAALAILAAFTSTARADDAPKHTDVPETKKTSAAPAAPTKSIAAPFTANDWQWVFKDGRKLVTNAPEVADARKVAGDLFTKFDGVTTPGKNTLVLAAYERATASYERNIETILEKKNMPDSKNFQKQYQDLIDGQNKHIEKVKGNRRTEQVRLLEGAGYKVLPATEKTGSLVYIDVPKAGIFQIELGSTSVVATPVRATLAGGYERRTVTLPVDQLLDATSRERLGIAPMGTLPAPIAIPLVSVTVGRAHPQPVQSVLELPEPYTTTMAAAMRTRFSLQTANINLAATAYGSNTQRLSLGGLP